MRHLKKLLVEKFIAIGVERGIAPKLAQETIQALIASEVVSNEKANAWEQDAQVYEWRAHKVPLADITRCYLISRSAVFNAVRRHGKRRRAVLRGERE